MQLAAEEKVHLNSDVNEYVKNWRIEENECTATEKATLERFLTHTAEATVHGLPGYIHKDAFPTIAAILERNGNTDTVIIEAISGSCRSKDYSYGSIKIVHRNSGDTVWKKERRTLQKKWLN